MGYPPPILDDSRIPIFYGPSLTTTTTILASVEPEEDEDSAEAPRTEAKEAPMELRATVKPFPFLSSLLSLWPSQLTQTLLLLLPVGRSHARLHRPRASI
jgi:hypothetical protein